MKRMTPMLLTAALCLGVAACSPQQMVTQMLSRQLQNNPSDAYLADTEAITVVMVGTGTPMPGERAQAATAVFVNGHFFMFDVGSGAVQKSENFGLQLSRLDGIFLTHYHSDHIMGLPNMIGRSWMRGRTHELTVYGPTGLAGIMESVAGFTALDNQHRVDHHGAEIMDPTYAGATASEFALAAGAPQVVYQQDGITITAFGVDHEPIEPAVGYVVEYRGKKVVISGDTKATAAVEQMAQGADLLVHEAMLMELQLQIAEANAQAGFDRNAKILRDITDYHCSPADVAALAQRAGVKQVVLTHLAPAPDNPRLKRRYMQEMAAFTGTKHVADDGDVFVVR